MPSLARTFFGIVAGVFLLAAVVALIGLWPEHTTAAGDEVSPTAYLAQQSRAVIAGGVLATVAAVCGVGGMLADRLARLWDRLGDAINGQP
jgi:hypothetical membrane protein